jgi:hypothetical protein
MKMPLQFQGRHGLLDATGRAFKPLSRVGNGGETNSLDGLGQPQEQKASARYRPLRNTQQDIGQLQSKLP